MSKALQKKISLESILNNNKVIFLISVILAVITWVLVTMNSGNVQTRSITVPVNVSLNNTYASQIGLKLISESSTDVAVEIRGKWSVISKITADDIQVRADVSSIQKAGEQQVSLIPSRNSGVADYDIISCTPSEVTIDCDYWKTTAIELQIETPSITAADVEGAQIGTPVTEVELTDNKVNVSGPQTVIDKISKLVAKVPEEAKLKETKTFTTTLQALDAEGKEVSLEHCTFAEFESTTVSIIVPVEISREVALTATWTHAPEALGENPFELDVNPKTITIVGPPEVMKTIGDTYSVHTIDFDNLADEYYVWDVDIPTDGSFRIASEETKAVISLDLRDYTTKEVAVNISDENVKIERNGKNLKSAIQKKTETITFIGKYADLEEIKPEDISMLVDVGESDVPGTSAYTGRVEVKGKPVWAYYGATGTGISVYVTLS